MPELKASRAEKAAHRFGKPGGYGNPEELLKNEVIDFMDITTKIDVQLSNSAKMGVAP